MVKIQGQNNTVGDDCPNVLCANYVWVLVTITLYGHTSVNLRINTNWLFLFSIRNNVACSIGPVPDLFITEQ